MNGRRWAVRERKTKVTQARAGREGAEKADQWEKEKTLGEKRGQRKKMGSRRKMPGEKIIYILKKKEKKDA